jgi:broad specificity phosphatase PhoE
MEQARELGDRYAGTSFDAIFCSDLQRSYKTAEIAFGDLYPIITDQRLRECNYGDLTGKPKKEVDNRKAQCISKPFPNGESYEQVAVRMKDFLAEIASEYDGKRVLVIGHRATQYGLEHILKNVPLLDTVTAPWQWQPGWTYEVDPLVVCP